MNPFINGNWYDDLIPGFFQFVIYAAANRVIDTDDRGPRAGLAMENTAFRGDIAFHTAMSFKMVFADIQQNSEIKSDRGDKFQLIGRHLQQIDAVLIQPVQGQRGLTKVATNLAVATRKLENMAQQGCGGGFTVRARNPDIG